MYFGILTILLAASFWGLGGVCGQFLYESHGADAVWLVMDRQFCAGLIFLAAASYNGENVWRPLREDWADLLKFSFFGVLGCQLGFYYCISLCNAATATVLQYLYPAMILVYCAYRERRWPAGREILGVVLALMGVFLLATHGRPDVLQLSPSVLVVGIGSGVSLAYYTIKPVEMLKKYTTCTLVGWGQLLSALPLLWWRSPFNPPGEWDFLAWCALAFLFLAATVGSYYLYLTGLVQVGPTKAALFCSFEPVVSVVSMVVLLGTKLSPVDYVGMGCIISMVVLLAWPRKV